MENKQQNPYSEGWLVDIVLDERIKEAGVVFIPGREAFISYLKSNFDYNVGDNEYAYTVSVIQEGHPEETYVIFQEERTNIEVISHEATHLAVRCLTEYQRVLEVDDEVEEHLATLVGEITSVIYEQFQDYLSKKLQYE